GGGAVAGSWCPALSRGWCQDPRLDHDTHLFEQVRGPPGGTVAEHLAYGVDQSAHAERPVARTDQCRGARVGREGAPKAGLLAQDDVLRVLGALQPELFLDDV